MADSVIQGIKAGGACGAICALLRGLPVQRIVFLRYRYFRSYVACLLVLAVYPLNAENLPDPTRPPASVMWGDAASADSAMQSRVAVPSAGLQSTIISKSRRAAIIGGKTIELGEKYGETRLVEVNEGSVVLRGTQTQQVLTLFPGVKMTHKESKTGKVLSGRAGPTAQEERK